MTVMIIYATVEGQTGKIANFAADKVRDLGSEVVTIDANTSEMISLDNIEAVILAAPVHERRHPRKFEAMLSSYREELEARPTLLLSVSLSAAFNEGLAEAKDYLTEMEMRTNFNPTTDACVAGAIRTSKYDYFASQIVRHVVLRDREFDSGVEEHEFTDWGNLANIVTAFLGAISGLKGSQMPPQ